MKRIIYAILAIPFLFASCDNFEEDERLEFPEGETIESTPITKNQTEQALLIEDFTGWDCPNCPEGTEILHQLKTAYGERLVVAAIHAGPFARPKADNNYVDFRTPYGDALMSQFNITSFPYGVFNRKLADQRGNWATRTEELLASTPHLMNISLGAEISGDSIIVSTQCEAVGDIAEELVITLYLAESGIEGVQNDHSNHIEYVFNHVLRSGARIDLPLTKGAISNGTVINKNYFFDLKNTNVVKPNECSVVVLVANAANGEVVQVNEIEL